MQLSPTPEVLDKIKGSVATLHDKLTNAQRYGWSKGNGEEISHTATGCYGSVSPLYGATNTPYFWAVFHGDGITYHLEDLADPVRKQNTMMEYTRPWNKFEGTERSLQWIKFLMSEQSPWKALHPFIVEKDLEFINNAGFIFNTANLPIKLWYNFLMAIRFPWEIPENYSVFLELQKLHPENPALALFISCNFMLKPKAPDWNGPWEIVYPWSFLEGLGVQEAKRFVNLNPGVIHGDNTPNVEPLWGVQGPSDMTLMFEDLSSKGTLTLDRIYSEIKGVL